MCQLMLTELSDTERQELEKAMALLEPHLCLRMVEWVETKEAALCVTQ